ncbi:MAG: hypothetical protein PVG71_04550 [Anaerolineae bacterium]|jgi:predicted GH43/DUF377 family glycosyl hydrolase
MRLVPYEDNPVLTKGDLGSWDSGIVFNGRVVLRDGQYHMFYNGAGRESETVAIGYAVSNDGRVFTKGAANPILEGDERGFDAIQVSDGVAMVETGTWILYYNAGVGRGPGRAIGRATAPSPTGPWSRRTEPVLRSGDFGAWDGGFISPQSIIRTDDGYVIYYVGGAGQAGEPARIGRATSIDGVSWTKHDDPDTVEPPFAESDPLLWTGPAENGESEWVWGCSVLKIRDGWEMFYAVSRSGVVQIDYATSTDGIEWTRYEEDPVLAPEDDPARAELETSILESPASVATDSTYYLYYDYGPPTGGIGLATGAAVGE